MAKHTVTTPISPPVRERQWPNPQMTLPRPPPNQPKANSPVPLLPTPRLGGGNS